MDWVPWTINCNLLYLPILYHSSGCVHWMVVENSKGRLMDSVINAVTLLGAVHWANKIHNVRQIWDKAAKVVFFLKKATWKRWILNHFLIWSYSRMNTGDMNKYKYLILFIHLLYNRQLSWLWWMWLCLLL